MYSDGRYHQTLGYLHIQFGNLDEACLDYLNAIEAFEREEDEATALQLTERLTELNWEINSPVAASSHTSLSIQLKIEIVRLCRLGLRHSRQYKYQIAINLLERSLQLSETLIDIDPHQGQYCAAITLGMMGKIYYAQRYYLFALAAFKASLDAYKSLEQTDKRTQGRIATILCEIANIAEITNHPTVAVEYYLDALWYLNASGQKPQAKQIMQQLDKLCHRPKPAAELRVH